jgi:stage V sporulation protein R
MNEGWATFWHYSLVNDLYDRRLINDGFMLEFLQSHTNVVCQRGFDERGFGGINPYALGFAMFTDLKRICESPTAEDRRWFPELAGADWLKSLDFAMRNFKDESFIGQFMSPKLMRDFHFFAVADHESEGELFIDAIHDEGGYRRVRKLLSEQYKRENGVPDIQVVRYDRDGDRSLTLRHFQARNRPLKLEEAQEVMKHMSRLWGFSVRLESVDTDGQVKSTLECSR